MGGFERWKRMKTFSKATILAACLAIASAAQQAPATAPGAQVAQQPIQGGNGADQIRPTYVLGPGDVITLRAFGVEEISDRPYRIDSEGDVNLAPILGKVHAAGLSVEQFEASLLERLRPIQRNPQVTVQVTQFRIDPVYLVGAFRAPGMINLQGRRTLREVL